MADFKTHLTFSTATGIGYGTVAHFLFQVPSHTCILAGTLCSLSGMLPDIDSDKGRPLKEIMSALAAMVPMLLLERLTQLQLTQETIVVVGIAAYFLVRFGFAAILRKTTVHRGMFHSIPMAVIFGEIAFLLTTGELGIRVYKASAVTLGYLSHLFLDEVYSIQWKRGLLNAKKSSGTAMKIYGKRFLPTLATYLQLALLTFLVIEEPNWVYDGEARSKRIEFVEQTLGFPKFNGPLEAVTELMAHPSSQGVTEPSSEITPPALPSPSPSAFSLQPAGMEPRPTDGLVPVRRPSQAVDTATSPWPVEDPRTRRY